MTVGDRNHTPAKKKFSLVPLSEATKTVSKFTTPEAQRRKSRIDYSHWEVFAESSPSPINRGQRQQQQQRQHSGSCGSEPQQWRNTPRTWSVVGKSRRNRDRSQSVHTPDRTIETSELFARQVAKSGASKRLDFKLHLDVPEFKPTASAPATKAAKPCLAPYNPEGGKLKDYAAYFFSQAYGLGDHAVRCHDDVISDAHALTSCSQRAIHEVLYGFSYDDVLGHLRAQVTVYPAKVPNKERNMDLNRSILLDHANALLATKTATKTTTSPTVTIAPTAAAAAVPAAAPSPVWEHAKRFATFAAPAALLLSPFIF